MLSAGDKRRCLRCRNPPPETNCSLPSLNASIPNIHDVYEYVCIRKRRRRRPVALMMCDSLWWWCLAGLVMVLVGGGGVGGCDARASESHSNVF